MRAEIRRLLRETDEASSFWDNTDLLDLWNQSKDYRELQLMQGHEGYGVVTLIRDIVDGKQAYELPETAERVKRISIETEDGKLQFPINRNERWNQPTWERTVGSSGFFLRHTYRIQGNHLFLDPKPTYDRKGGLIIEVEQLSERTISDTDKLPDSWPTFAETLLILDTAIAAYDMEGADAAGDSILTSYMLRRTEYSSRWEDFIETRSFGLVFATPHKLGP